MLRPTSGEVRYDGAPVARMGDAYRALLGYLPQDFGYYPEFTALDFMEYMAALKGLGRRDARDRSLALLDRVGLSGEGRRRIRTFSGGMRQRLGIAQAVLNDPEVLVLDEPTAGLDPRARRACLDAVRAAAGEGATVVIASHDANALTEVADRLVVLEEGRVTLDGPARTLLADAPLMRAYGLEPACAARAAAALRRAGIAVPGFPLTAEELADALVRGGGVS